MFRTLDYSKEKDIKCDHIKDSFRKNAHMSVSLDDVRTYRSERYRNNVRYPIGRSEDGHLFAGFFAERSHKVVRVDDCMTQKECFKEVLDLLLEKFENKNFTPYDENTGKGVLRHFCLRCNRKNEISVCVVINDSACSQTLKKIADEIMEQNANVVNFYVNFNRDNTNVIFGDKTVCVSEKKSLTEELCGRSFIVSPRSFFQVNTETAEMLFNKASEYLDAKENDVIIDLYCGTGTVGMCTVPLNAKLYGCEIVKDAVDDAVLNAEKNGFRNYVYECCDASEGIANCEKHFGRANAVIVDPPRKGLSSETVDAILKSGIAKLVYISCNPDTLARDVSLLSSGGYELKKISSFDMFPRTSHVESVVLMSRA